MSIKNIFQQVKQLFFTFGRKTLNFLKNKLSNHIFLFKSKVKQSYFLDDYYYLNNQKNNNSWLKKKNLTIQAVLSIACLLIVFLKPIPTDLQLISPLSVTPETLRSLTSEKNSHEVFGFAPYWTFNKLDNVDFNVLTTFAYFGVPLDRNGNLDRSDIGYSVFKSKRATQIFKKAHFYGTRVVLTVTQMNNAPIRELMDSPEAQENAINQIVSEVKERGIDGVNVDMEYVGNPGQGYRNKYSNFVSDLTRKMHQEIPDSKVTVSVYASAVKEPKIYDIAALAANSDGIFMMAYDFGYAASENAIPTAPLYGYKEGKYWYDVASAVDDFLKYMPEDKLILGVPYYGYNYSVNKPQVKASTFRWGGSMPQTYSYVQESIGPDNRDSYVSGWDEYGKVGWKAYFDYATYTWRMIFLDDERSLSLKYDYAKEKNLKGVGIWALGFDDDKRELWALLRDKFGNKLTDTRISDRTINDNI